MTGFRLQAVVHVLLGFYSVPLILLQVSDNKHIHPTVSSFQLSPYTTTAFSRHRAGTNGHYHGSSRTTTPSSSSGRVLKTSANGDGDSLDDMLVSESMEDLVSSVGISSNSQDFEATTRIPTGATTTTSAAATSSSRPLSNRQLLEEQYPHFPRTWVPLASTLELDPTRPNRLEFLDQSYVAYYSSTDHDDESQKWVVLDNTCPHRLAPLSEGRVEPETGRLQCSYHGWTFEADGSCQRIPQVTSSVEQSAAFGNNPRSCVPSYSTVMDAKTGVLWIWPWQQDPLSPEFAGEDNAWRLPEGFTEGLILDPTVTNATEAGIMTYTRDQPYGWDTLVENLIDPAHIPFAHHGMQGTRDDAIPINMTRASSQGEAGFSFVAQDRTLGLMRQGEGKFRAPYLVNYNATFNLPGGGAAPFRLSALCIPTRPGWSRVMVFSIPNNRPKAEKKAERTVNPFRILTRWVGKLKAALFRKSFPTWKSHLLSNKFFDSDLAFLHYQEQLRFGGDGNNNNSNNPRGDARYFMPAECDRSIVALHGWMANHASSYIQRQSRQLPPAIYDRSKLFDHYEQHTSKCKICLAALAQLQRRKRQCQKVLAASILLGFRFWAVRLVAVACLEYWRRLSITEKDFYTGEFKHYDNH